MHWELTGCEQLQYVARADVLYFQTYYHSSKMYCMTPQKKTSNMSYHLAMTYIFIHEHDKKTFHLNIA